MKDPTLGGTKSSRNPVLGLRPHAERYSPPNLRWSGPHRDFARGIWLEVDEVWLKDFDHMGWKVLDLYEVLAWGRNVSRPHLQWGVHGGSWEVQSFD